ncbi:hypothetical protein [Micromonospora sp. S4605]|uniref:hypothetical protein n=1 Tax=Micromonospora sp. S4605 TaxID=1420897 RepID=UPI0011B51B95|nr:hypothetical protein [Micromonospora sp. S4605]
MTTTRAGGEPAYVAAHRIAVVDRRLSFEQAYCLAKLVLDHGGGPAAPDRNGPISVKHCKALAAEDLVELTGELSEVIPVTVRLTVPASLLDNVHPLRGQKPIVETAGGGRRKKVEWFAVVTQEGLDLVAAAMASTASE